jgi:hypothetical protein
VKEKSILFSAPMIRAIRENRKDQTRRLSGLDAINEAPDQWTFKSFTDPVAEFVHGETGEVVEVRCPYGPAGTHLWVRETWQAIHVCVDPETGYGDDIIVCDSIPKNDGSEYVDLHDARTKPFWSVVYAATDPQAEWHKDDRGFGWRPSLFMPRWASRITLEVTGIRVERLQDITEADAKAEGVERTDELTGTADDILSLRHAYSLLWDKINGKTHPWKSNPYVWVVQFKVVQP